MANGASHSALAISESTGEELQQFDAVANFLEETLLVILCLSYSSLFLQSSLGGYTEVI